MPYPPLPHDPDWNEWVPVTATRNWMNDDPLLDWLDLYGEQHGFARDNQGDDYIHEVDFGNFIRKKGIQFEEAVLRLIEERIGEPAVRVCYRSDDCRNREAVEVTLGHMDARVPLIYQAALWHPDTKLYGTPDLLVRLDLLHLLCDSVDPIEENPHYAVVEIKFRTFELDRNLEAGSNCKQYKSQLGLYNDMLGRLVGQRPKRGYFIGRGWKSDDGRSESCLSRLIPVTLPLQPQGRRGSRDWVVESEEALSWIRTVRTEGADWKVLPEPSDRRLRPNMKNTKDSPWHNAKVLIADHLGEPSRIWQIGAGTRRDLYKQDIYSWRDPRFIQHCSADAETPVGKRRQRMMEINGSEDGPNHHPAKVGWARDEWFDCKPLEFFVDFETTSNLDDDFSSLPNKGGQTLIFMIGCGHFEPVDFSEYEGDASWVLYPSRRRWVFKVFAAQSLAPAEEGLIIMEWAAYMNEVQARTPNACKEPKVFHWSAAETASFDTGYESAYRRHGQPTEWPKPNWFDFLGKVVRPKDAEEAFFVKGAWGFGLKAMGKALASHGLIETNWQDGPADGLAAMGGSWACYRIAQEQGRPVHEVVVKDRAGREHLFFQQIVDYNEMDCKVMAECIQFIRSLG